MLESLSDTRHSCDRDNAMALVEARSRICRKQHTAVQNVLAQRHLKMLHDSDLLKGKPYVHAIVEGRIEAADSNGFIETVSEPDKWGIAVLQSA